MKFDFQLGRFKIGLTPNVKNSSETIDNHFGRLAGSGRQIRSSTFRNTGDFMTANETASYVGTLASKLGLDLSRLSYDIIDKQNKSVSNSHAWALIEQPQNGFSYEDVLQHILLHIVFDGNIFAYKLFKNMRQKVEGKAGLFIANPALTQVWAGNQPVSAAMKTTAHSIDRYEINKTLGGMLIVEPDDMIHIRMQGPHNLVRGMGVIQRGTSVYDQDALTTAFERKMYENGGFTRLGLQFDADVGIEQLRRAMAEFKEATGGMEKAGDTHFYPPGATAVFPDQKMTDMEMLDSKKWTKQDVATQLDMPGIMAGLESKFNDQNSEFAYYNQFTLQKWGRPIERFFTAVVKTVDPSLRFVLRYPFSVSTERAQQVRDAYNDSTLTGNEYREALGFEPDESDEHLNTRYTTFNKIPVDMVRETVESETDPEPAPAEGKALSPCGHTKIEQSEEMSLAQQKFLMKALRTKALKIEKKMFKEVKGFYKEFEKRVITGLEKAMVIEQVKAADIGDMFGPLETEEAMKHARRMFTAAINLSLNDFNDSFSADVDTSFKNPDVQLVVEQLSKNYADSTMNSRRKEIKSILQKNLDAGEGISAIKSDLQANFDTLNGENAWKSLRIAKTEASYAYDRGSLIGFDDLGYNGNFDIVGCDDLAANCNRKGISRQEMTGLIHHPNHRGVMVPSTLGKWCYLNDVKYKG